MTITHADDCVHPPMYDGGEECEPFEGVWNRPQGSYVREAQFELDDDAPWCRIQQRAWELQAQED